MALREHLPPVRLDGQVALVTGAGRGTGRAIALALSDAGAAVAVCARSKDEVTSVAGGVLRVVFGVALVRSADQRARDNSWDLVMGGHRERAVR